MAQGQFSGNLYFIDQNETATLSGRHFFHTLVNGDTAVEVTVKGGGVFEFVDVSELADDAAAALYIDPLTGLPFTAKSVAVDSDHGDGFYEKIGSSAITISLGPNQIVCGRFTEVAVANTDNAEVHAYTG
tara:strand:- start:2474 stop:2863 length:390 start_codon:yes stop_codon:yes gene_type:complete